MSNLKKTIVPETDTEKVSETITEKVTETKTSARKNTKAAKKKEASIYIGPDIKGIVNHCDVFSDEIDSRFAEKMKEVPILKNLFFPISEGGEKLANLKKGMEISKLYKAAEQKLKEGDSNE